MIRTRQLRTTLALGLATGATLAVAGCGGANKPATTGGSGSPKAGISAVYKFSTCMRNHGVSGFPDPVVQSSPGHQSVGIRITPAVTGSPSYKSAQQACGKLLPGPGPGGGNGDTPQQLAARVRGFVSFAGCMRSHQVPTFPDPNSQGRLTPQALSAAGINLKAPAVRAAAFACVPASQGQITRAQIAIALNGGGGQGATASSASPSGG